jgi:O-antigen/teichoic acid export membrane protein
VYAFGLVVILLVALFTTPILLHHLGLALMGIVGIATQTISFLTVIDPGFADIVTRYGAQARVRGETRVAARVCALGSMFWLGFGVILAPLVYFGVPVLVDHLKGLGLGAQGPVTDFFYWTFLLIIFGSLLATLSGRLTAIGAHYIVTVIDTSTRLVYCAVLIVLLEDGWKLSAIVAATSAQYLLAFVATMVAVVVKDGRPYASPRGLDTATLREIYRFGGLLQLNSVLDTVTNDTDNIVLGVAVNVHSSGLYNIINRLARLITYFAYVPQQSVLPGMSAAFAADEGLGGVRRIYERAQRVIVPIGAFLAGTVVAFGPLMLQAWLGNPYWAASAATVIVALTMMVGLPRPATANAIMATGRVGLGVRAQWLAFIVNLVLTLALVKPFGLNGVVFGTLAARASASGYLLVRFSRSMQASFRELCWSWIWPLIIVTGVSATAGRIAMLQWHGAFATRHSAVVALIVLGLAYTAIYAIGLRLTRFFRFDDLVWLRSVAPGGLGTVISPGVIKMLTGERR